MEDGISGGLQHCHETCCEKGGCRGRRACMVWRWFHYKDIVSRQVDLYMTNTKACELDVVEELKVEERDNLFAIFPIGATIQDGGKRKRSN